MNALKTIIHFFRNRFFRNRFFRDRFFRDNALSIFVREILSATAERNRKGRRVNSYAGPSETATGRLTYASEALAKTGRTGTASTARTGGLCLRETTGSRSRAHSRRGWRTAAIVR